MFNNTHILNSFVLFYFHITCCNPKIKENFKTTILHFRKIKSKEFFSFTIRHFCSLNFHLMNYKQSLKIKWSFVRLSLSFFAEFSLLLLLFIILFVFVFILLRTFLNYSGVPFSNFRTVHNNDQVNFVFIIIIILLLL